LVAQHLGRHPSAGGNTNYWVSANAVVARTGRSSLGNVVRPWFAGCALSRHGNMVGPLMARVEAPNGGLLPERYQLLMRTHWLRVGIVSTYAVLALWMLAQSAWPI
jgi:hypothetical protein